MTPQAQTTPRRPLVTPHSIVEAVAEREGVPPMELEPALADSIDPDALEALLDRSRSPSPVEIRFDYAGYGVTVDSDGEIVVE